MTEFPGYTRVTDVLFPFSGLKAIDPEILKNAADRGSRVHLVIDGILKGLGECHMGDDILGYIESFHKWYEGGSSKEFLPKPNRFFNDAFKITGECDAIYKDSEGKLVLVDFKTPLRESKTWRLQGSAYSFMAEREGYPIDRIEFVKLDKKGEKAQIFIYERVFELFWKCLDVYDYFFANQVPEENIDYL